MRQKIREAFPRITENQLIDEIAVQAVHKEYIEGESVIKVGEYITSVPLILSGTVKISRINDNGQEVFLYYLKKGDTCADTLQCCFANQKSNVSAVAEENTALLLVDIRMVNLWSSKYKSWKEFVMLSFKDKFNQLLEALDAIAFQKIDERLLAYLKERQNILQTSELHITHQDIAYDLNTSREVISRLLKSLENTNQVKLGRNRITIL